MIRNRIIIILIMILLMPSAAYLEAAEQEVVMEIKGMTCLLCPLAVKKALKKVDGVSNVKVSYEKGEALFTVEETVADKVLINAVKKAGAYNGKIIKRKSKE